MSDADLESFAIGVFLGVGALLYILISAALSDRRSRDGKPEDKPKPKD